MVARSLIPRHGIENHVVFAAVPFHGLGLRVAGALPCCRGAFKFAAGQA
jgi:hypothetical protein